MKSSQILEAHKRVIKKAKQKFVSPPELKTREPEIFDVISNDRNISGHETNDIVFVDLSPIEGMAESDNISELHRNRFITVRDTKGLLRHVSLFIKIKRVVTNSWIIHHSLKTSMNMSGVLVYLIS